MTGRTRQILERFPAHFEAIRTSGRLPASGPSKRFEAVVEALAQDLDEMATDLGAIRRSHRVAHADTIGDVLRLSGIHGYGPVEVEVLFARVEWTRKMVKALKGAANDAARRAAADKIFDMWGLDIDLVLPNAEDGTDPPRLALYAPSDADPTTFDVSKASQRMALHVADAFRHRNRIDLARRRVVRNCAIGNGTVRALMEAAANALDLDMDIERNDAAKVEMAEAGLGTLHPAMHDEYFHAADRFWHGSFVEDRVRLTRQVLVAEADVDPTPLAQRKKIVRLDTPYDSIGIGELARQLSTRIARIIEKANTAGITQPGDLDALSVIPAETVARIAALYGYETWQVIPRAEEILGIEENPLRRETAAPMAVRHAQLSPPIHVLRRGFGDAFLRVTITGKEDKTYGPMVVNRETGDGVGFIGTVPDGKDLVFTEEGRVFLDGDDVTSLSYSFRGACFADQNDPDPDDFVFTGPDTPARKRARFVIMQPEGQIDRDGRFPHAGNAIVAPPIGIGSIRFGYFVNVVHFNALDPGTPPKARLVTPRTGAGLFDSTVFDAGTETTPESATLSLSWLEHEGYAVRVIIPARFALLDEDLPDDQKVAARVKRALERVRPAGVALRVDYLAEEWILGRGRLPSENDDDPIIRLRGGSQLPTAPEGT